jgi:hypothetical protein
MYGPGTVVVVVKQGASPRRSAELLRWLRCLLPAALLVVSPAALPVSDGPDVVTLDADAAADAGPLAVAASIVEKARAGAHPVPVATGSGGGPSGRPR